MQLLLKITTFFNYKFQMAIKSHPLWVTTLSQIQIQINHSFFLRNYLGFLGHTHPWSPHFPLKSYFLFVLYYIEATAKAMLSEPTPNVTFLISKFKKPPDPLPRTLTVGDHTALPNSKATLLWLFNCRLQRTAQILSWFKSSPFPPPSRSRMQ